MVSLLLLANLLGIIVIIYSLRRGAGDSQARALTRQRQEINQALKDNTDSVNKQLANLLKLQSDNTVKLTATLQDRLESLQKDNHQQLERMRQTVDEKLQKTLKSRLTESFDQVNSQLKAVYEGLGEMQSLASNVGDLQQTLSNVKTRGIWGEAHLGNLLSQTLNASQYEVEFKLQADSDERVDFALKIPRAKGTPLYLPLDAKFPLTAYEDLVKATNQGEAATIKSQRTKFIRAVDRQAKSIGSKYINPPTTTDFAIMYLPVEGLYAEIAQQTGLLEKLRLEYKVAIAGPTTILPLLNFIDMGYKTLAIQKRSSEVWQTLVTVSQEFSKFGDLVDKAAKNVDRAPPGSGYRQQSIPQNGDQTGPDPTTRSSRGAGVRPPVVNWFGDPQADRAIIYVHGYATDWRSEGLFTGLAQALQPLASSVLSDLSDYDHDGNCYFLPLDQQHQRLNSLHSQLGQETTKIIIGHSLGCLVAASWLVDHRIDCDQVIYLAPSLRDGVGPTITDGARQRPGAVQEPDGTVSWQTKRAGRIVIPPEFSRQFDLKARPIHQRASKRLPPTAILAEQDLVRQPDDIIDFFGATVIPGADHNFLETMPELTEILRPIIKA